MGQRLIFCSKVNRIGEKNQTPFNDGVAGLDVVRMLAAAEKSLSQKGGMVYL